MEKEDIGKNIFLEKRREMISHLVHSAILAVLLISIPVLYYQIWQVMLVNVAFIGVLAVIFYRNQKDSRYIGDLLIFFISLCIFINSSMLGWESGVFAFFFTAIFGLSFGTGYLNKTEFWFNLLHPLIFVLMLLATDSRLLYIQDIPPMALKIISYNCICINVMLFQYLVYRVIVINQKIEERLHKQNLELSSSNEALEVFFHSISHDIKAPIAQLMGLTEIMRDEQDFGKLKKYNLIKEKSLANLNQFVNELLDQAVNKRKELDIEEIDFANEIKKIVDSFSQQIHQSSIQVEQHIFQNQPFYSDLFRIKLLLQNIISNAIRYHDEQKSKRLISITAEVTTGQCVLRIRDNGVGIPQDSLDKIFDLFYRASAEIKGTGLGLYIAKAACDKIKGKITVDSMPKEYTSFTISLPDLR